MHDCQLNGFYRGIVKKHLSNGKCKIWIAGVYPEAWNTESDNDINKLPDAEQASLIQFGANNGNGVFSYPNIGSVVWCFFQDGDQNLPVYFASTLGGEKAGRQWDNARPMASSDPNKHNPDDAYVHHVKVGHSHIYANEAGYIKIVTHKNEDEDADSSDKCTLCLDRDGNITLDSTSTITLNAKNIVLHGDLQVDVVAKNISQNASTQLQMKSPAICIDSHDGHTTILSRAFFSSKNLAVSTF